MDLRPGYKQTEIGVLPEDWDTRALGALSAFITKGATPTTYGFSWEKVGISFFRSESITENGIDPTNSQKISAEAHRMLKRSEILSGDILIAITGYVGRVAIYHSDEPANINQHVARIRIVSDEADAGFLFHWLTQKSVRRSFENITTGQAYPQISLKQVREAVVPLPPIHEQRAVSEALSDLDSTIERLWNLITKKRDMRAGVLRRLLTGETRLPGFSEPWREKRLGDHVSFLKNGVQSRAQLTLNDPVRYLHYGDIHVAQSLRLHIRETEMPRLPTLEAARLSRLEDGDLVFVDASEDLAGVGKSLEVTGSEGIEAVAGQHTIAARFDKDVLADGFKGYLQHIPAFTTHLRRLAAGTKVYATNRKHIASAEILLPEPDEQRAIVRVLSDMDAEITTLEARLEKTRALKQGMMQALLTGRVRLPVQGEALDTLEVAHA